MNPDTPVTFSRTESDEIRRLAMAADEPLVCPRCGADLLVREPAGRSARTIWEIRCTPCHRSTFVTEVAEGRRPEA